MNYQEALEYLDSFIDYEKISTYDYNLFGLKRIKRLLAYLDNPQDKIKAIQIGGTKGKGSTCAFVSSILKEAGFKVGLYTSPHLINFRERIKVLDKSSEIFDGDISEDEVSELVKKMKPHIERTSKELDTLTYFEIITAVAFLYFSNKKVDFMVLEVGLGGRLDATSVINALVCGITSISLEHTKILGSTLEEITKEKIAIVKKATTVIAPQEKEVKKIIDKICKEKRIQLYEVGKDIIFEGISCNQEKQTFNVRGIFNEFSNLTTRLLGEHQLLNAATAVGIIESLRPEGIYISPDAIRDGIKAASWPGRLEVMCREPLIVLDGAQTKESALALRKAVIRHFSFNKIILVLGICDDKDIKSIFEQIKGISSKVIITRALNPRAAGQEVIKKYTGKDVFCTDNIEQAIEKAKSEAGNQDMILVTGSLYIVGEARKVLCLKD